MDKQELLTRLERIESNLNYARHEFTSLPHYIRSHITEIWTLVDKLIKDIEKKG